MSKRKPLPPQELLLKLLRYEPETGKLFWRERPREMFKTLNAYSVWNARWPDTEALALLSRTGLTGTLLGRSSVSAHRVIWKMVHNEDPHQVYHRDGDVTNNRVANLVALERAPPRVKDKLDKNYSTSEPKPLPSQELLNQLLRYEPETGKLFWIPRPIEMFPTDRARSAQASWNGKHAGKEAFTVTMKRGYKVGAIFRVGYLAHRVIWKMCFGDEPETIDHIDQNPSNNRLSNLRSVSQKENSRNATMDARNTSGHNGIFWNKKNSNWTVKMTIDWRSKYVGSYASLDEAVSARDEAYAKHGFHPNHGRRKR